jgi:hypothetical protein
MPVVPRKGPHPFAKPLVVFGVKRPRSSAIATEPCPTDTSALDPEPPENPSDPTDITRSPSWLEGPYGPAAEARQEEFEALVLSGEVSLASVEKLTAEAKAKA